MSMNKFWISSSSLKENNIIQSLLLGTLQIVESGLTSIKVKGYSGFLK